MKEQKFFPKIPKIWTNLLVPNYPKPKLDSVLDVMHVMQKMKLHEIKGKGHLMILRGTPYPNNDKTMTKG